VKLIGRRFLTVNSAGTSNLKPLEILKEPEMSLTHFAEEPNQEQRIAKLREEIGSWAAVRCHSKICPDMEEEFLRHVLEYETAEPISLFRMLENSGLDLPSPESLGSVDVTTKLTETLERMASLGAYLLHTNHLSDLALYEYLYNDGLREEAVLFPENPGYAYMIDLTGSGSEEDNHVYLKYYADEKQRHNGVRLA
jgi:hypothetical protein